MYLEGVLVPFKSAVITCTPNGVEASINIYSSENVYDLKPKTAVQIFFKEWFGAHDGWKIMFDGAVSSFYEIDEAANGRMLSISCRDFRMDIRKAPAAMAFPEEDSLGTMHMYHKMGMFQTWAAEGVDTSTAKGRDIKAADGKLLVVSEMVSYIAGSAGFAGKKQANGEYAYDNYGGDTRVDLKGNDKNRAGLFLDAVVRGIWIESVGGTSIGAFLNKRLRVDKKFIIPVNKSGAKFWTRNNASATLGSFLMGNAVFTSVEAAIMRLGSLFNTRVYSCNSPSLIPVDRSSEANEFVIDDSVRNFIVDKHGDEFGGKYMIGETMLLPPLEFTTPPNCNILFPSMYHRVEWRQDWDVDYTRGYFRMTNLLTNETSESEPFTISYQVPNELFNSDNARIDKRGRSIPPLTEEEKFKGVNILFDTVEYELACEDAASTLHKTMVNKETYEKINNEISNFQKKLDDIRLKKSNTPKTSQQQSDLYDRIYKKQIERDRARLGAARSDVDLTESSIKRHALIKYLNSRYIGRVVSIESMFNPYVMCGFPCLVIAGSQPGGGKPMKDIIGMVQQVRHSIYISTDSADASTSLVVSGPRFTDEPTDMDVNGNPVYMRETDPVKAEIDTNTLEYKSNYLVPNPKPSVVKVTGKNSTPYDTIIGNENSDYKYSKDLLTMCESDSTNAKSTEMFVDQVYEPNHIAKFYKTVLRHQRDSFMVGSHVVDGGRVSYFMYDTIHEAVEKLKSKSSFDYNEAMEYVYRDVCSADAFYHGILGVSSLENGKFVVRDSNFIDNKIDDRYFGVSTDKYESKDIDELKVSNGGRITGPGDFSTIDENMPITYFIKERRVLVEQYLKSVIESSRHTKYV